MHIGQYVYNGEGGLRSKLQLPSSYGLGVKVYEDIFTKDQWSMSDEGICRTPTPVLLIKYIISLCKKFLELACVYYFELQFIA